MVGIGTGSPSPTGMSGILEARGVNSSVANSLESVPPHMLSATSISMSSARSESFEEIAIGGLRVLPSVTSPRSRTVLRHENLDTAEGNAMLIESRRIVWSVDSTSILIRRWSLFFFNLVFYLFSNNMPHGRLHATSVVLLCTHFFVKKIRKELPKLIIRFSSKGGAQDCIDPERSVTDNIGVHKMIFDLIVESLRPLDLSMKTPTSPALPSLLQPLMVLSLLILATLSMYLTLLVTFYFFLYLSSIASSDSISNSPVQCMIMLSFLPMLDYVLPWMLSGIGLYFTFSKTGFVWFMFLVSSTLVMFHGVSI